MKPEAMVIVIRMLSFCHVATVQGAYTLGRYLAMQTYPYICINAIFKDMSCNVMCIMLQRTAKPHVGLWLYHMCPVPSVCFYIMMSDQTGPQRVQLRL
eukprot:jgi/Botrbrau1/13148/Bobra.0187s0096.1